MIEYKMEAQRGPVALWSKEGLNGRLWQATTGRGPEATKWTTDEFAVRRDYEDRIGRI